MKNHYYQAFTLKHLLFCILGFVVLGSCEKDFAKEQEKLKDPLYKVSSQSTIASGGSIIFTDLSLGVANRLWTFPGGTPATSNEAEVEVIFSEVGDIVSSLKIDYVDGTTENINIPIKVYPELIAGFTMSANRIKVGESVTFTDNSIGEPTSWNWEFEGGTPASSAERNPTVQFDINAPVNIKLTVTRAADGNSASKEAILQVGPPELCLNGNFETGVGPVIDWQTWNGSPFPYNVVAGGADGTAYTSMVDFKGSWGWGQIIGRDFPNNMISLENGNDYILSMYVKAEAPIRLDQFRGVNHLPAWSAAFPVGGVEEGYEEFYAISGTSLPVNITTDWTHVSVRISIPDDGKTRSNFFPDIILGGDVDSKVYIDEISVKIVD